MIQLAEGPGHTVDPLADELTNKAAAAASRAVRDSSLSIVTGLKKKR